MKAQEAAQRDYVIGRVFFEDGLFIDDALLRESLDTEDIFNYYDEIEAEIAAIKKAGYPKDRVEAFRDKYLSNTFYEPYHGRAFAPQEMFRSIEEKIGSFRDRVETRTKRLMGANPAIIKTLHDEVAGPRNFFGSAFIVGNIPGAKNAEFAEGLDGDMGLSGGSVMPGSFKHLWQFRTGKLFGTVEGVSKLSAAMGLKNFSEWVNTTATFDSSSVGEARLVRTMNGLDEVTELDLTVDNASDASAQAVTAARALYSDWAINNWDDLDPEAKEGLDKQKEFIKYLKKAKKFFQEEGGFGAMKDNVLTEADDFVSDTGDDKYSKVGLSVLRETASGGWKVIADALDDDGESNTLKDMGPLGAFLRKEIFKRPVMTLSLLGYGSCV